MIIYLAGPMRSIKDFNYPAFFETAKKLRDLGHTVNNPAENCGLTLEKAVAFAKATEPSKTFADYFRPDLMMIADSDAMCMLPGWRGSRGASLEYTIGREMGLPIYRLCPVSLNPDLEPLNTVVGVSGYAGTGKDTIARALVEGLDYERLSFADVVRDVLYELNPWVRTMRANHDDWCQLRFLVDTLGWDMAKRDNLEIRRMLQRMGGGARRVISADVWVDAVLARMADGQSYVISDLRYPNEAEAVKRLGGSVWRVERDGIGPINDHESEVALDAFDFDLAISNDSTISRLYEEAVAAG